ncbi:MAG TPA: FAD-binding oxidoreductase, partial [Thermoanaerobaculia bacterium]
KAVIGLADEEAILRRMGVDYRVLDSGCCGMAGSFGFEQEHYEISMKVGERVLLPAVRAASPEALLIVNGFSCREQVAQATGKRAYHLAEVIEMGMGAR